MQCQSADLGQEEQPPAPAQAQAQDYLNPLYGQERSPSLGPPSARGYRYFDMAGRVGSSADGLVGLASTPDIGAHSGVQLPERSHSWGIHASRGIQSSPLQASVLPANALSATMPDQLPAASQRQRLAPLALAAQLAEMQTPRGSRKPLVTVQMPLDQTGCEQPVTLSLSTENSARALPPGLASEWQSHPLAGISSSHSNSPLEAEVSLVSLERSRDQDQASDMGPGPAEQDGPMLSRRQAALVQLKMQRLRRSALDRSGPHHLGRLFRR